jgi:hypothetical protein
MRRRPRLLFAGLGVAVAAGLALGFTLTRGGPENAFAQGPPGVLASGELKTVSWGTNGTVTVERTRTGKVILRFSRDFRTQRAPALYVHMGSRRMVLQRPWGEQSYVLSGAGPAALHATVQVFCEKCNKAWGEAKLHATNAA